MQKCEKCHVQFNWKKIYKSFWWTYKPITCANCGSIHKITIPGRLTFVSFTFLPILVFAYFLSPFNNINVNVGIGLVISIVGSLLAPFFVTYKESL